MEPDRTLAAIEASDANVVLLRGPAGSGKTSSALKLYEQNCPRTGPAEAIFLTPSAVAKKWTLSHLLRRRPGGAILGPKVMTFSTLAARILASTRGTISVLSDLQRRIRLGRILDDLTQAGEIPSLSAVASAPGSVAALDRSISELKRAAIEPERLREVVPVGPCKQGDLARIYTEYQTQLRQQDVYDREGVMWLARDALASDVGAVMNRAELASAPVIIVDGFTDFTPTQLQILRYLAGWANRVLITLPCDDDGRHRMWLWARRSLDALRRTWGDGLHEIELSAPDLDPADLSSSWTNLLRSLPGDTASPDGLGVIAAAGIESEIRAVARRVKKLLVDDPAAGSVAVLARSPEAYRPTIERIFDECSIPIAASATALTDVPIVRFLLQVARLPGGGDFLAIDVLRIIRSSYFSPSALGRYDSQIVSAAEMVIREGNVYRGRHQMRDVAEGLIASPHRADPEDSDKACGLSLGPLTFQPDDIRRAVDMVEALFEAAESASTPKGFCELIDRLGLEDTASRHEDDRLASRDLQGIAALRSAVRSVEEESPSMPRLLTALETITVPPPRGEQAVEVLGVLDARAVRFDHVFLVGMSEGQFPGKFTESPMIGEGNRSRWRQAGLDLDTREFLTAREMLLFYLACTRADRSLTISYQHTDSAGRPSAPSAFLLSSPAIPLPDRTGCEGRVEVLDLGEFAPGVDQIAEPKVALLAGAAGLFDASLDPQGRSLAWCAGNRLEVLRRIARGLFSRHARWQSGPCDRFDGVLTDPALVELLANRYPHQETFSATGLGEFGQCPWQFFASHVLQLRPLAEPERDMEAVSRGIFVHDVLFRVMTSLRERSAGPLDLSLLGSDELSEALDLAIAAECEGSQPAYPLLWEAQVQQMRSEMLAYLLTQNQAGARPRHFELAFGLGELSAGLSDPASTPRAVELETPGGIVRLRGKIDRVDDSDAGSFVVDYKTGALPTYADIREGRSLQLPLYTEAAEQLLAGSVAGGAFHRIGGSSDTREFSASRVPKKETREFSQRREDILALVGEFVSRMAEGRFDALPTHKCPSYCAYRQICHFSHPRAERKDRPSQTETSP